ncbi:SDR family NAD(P)-dependent oxidoreductase [Leucobacter manosquensis]|uniref:SDR family oxidoreductase n=1 Tax=Leucobacter manosquensis TaxID=2810611 RepID=A0ABS5M5J1_9MICO|nr:SDR family oxidoreductase [Leucobacter manosquensis]
MNTGGVVVVTGGAGAFGAAISRELAENGCTVIIADRDLEAAERVAATIEGASFVALDLGDESSISACVDAVVARHGRLDVLVNNAGYSPPGGVGSTELVDFDRAISVNLRGAYLMSVAALPHLRAAPAARIVMVGSRTWLAGGNPAYTASKAGVVGLARSFVHALGPSGGTCNVVAPGPVDTPLVDDMVMGESRAENFRRYAAASPLRRVATPEDVARAVAFFAGPGGAFITGEVLHVAGGLQLAPPL